MNNKIFNPMHKALRASMYDTAQAVQQTNFLDTAEVDEAIDKIEKTLVLFHLHSIREGEFIHPLSQEFHTEILRQFNKQHTESEFLTNRVKLAVVALDNSFGPSDKIKKGKKLVSAVEAMVAFNINLFARKEEVLNIFFWSNYHDKEVMPADQSIIANVPAKLSELENKWMLKALNNLEIEAWLKVVKESATDPEFQSLLLLAEKELSFIRFEKLLDSLSIEMDAF
ncbi:hypothetical protein [Dyadobacter sp. NIV53]|uniref:hypothetical protein n=1 Tax=Dyadobacter sp. NIV53 TaxID=2861765 RepID=UPI001C86BE6F|nr:hypothetical protein [Dyadobacter sp. NIV53]